MIIVLQNDLKDSCFFNTIGYLVSKISKRRTRRKYIEDIVNLAKIRTIGGLTFVPSSLVGAVTIIALHFSPVGIGPRTWLTPKLGNVYKAFFPIK